MTASNTAIETPMAPAAPAAPSFDSAATTGATAATTRGSDSATAAGTATPATAIDATVAATAAAPASPTTATSASATSAPTTPELDPRIARSRAALREAFIALVEERGIDGFSVGDLCTSAGLNRGTFYNHFRDKESLLASFEDEVIEGLGGVLAKFQSIKLRELAACSLTHRPLPMLVELYDYLREEGPFLHAMLGPGGDARFGMRLREAVCGRFVKSLLHERYQNDPSAFTRYYISFYSGAYLGVISEWIDSGMTETSEEMALISMRLLFIKPGESIKM